MSWTAEILLETEEDVSVMSLQEYYGKVCSDFSVQSSPSRTCLKATLEENKWGLLCQATKQFMRSLEENAEAVITIEGAERDDFRCCVLRAEGGSTHVVVSSRGKEEARHLYENFLL